MEAQPSAPGRRCVDRKRATHLADRLAEGQFAVAPEEGRRLLAEQPVAGVTLAHLGECVERGLWLEEGGQRRALEPRGWVHALE